MYSRGSRGMLGGERRRRRNRFILGVAGGLCFVLATELVLLTAPARAGVVAARGRLEFLLCWPGVLRIGPRRPRGPRGGTGKLRQVELQHESSEGIGVLDIHAGMMSG